MKSYILSVFLAMLISSACIAQKPGTAWVRVATDYGMASKIDTIVFVITDGYRSQTIYTIPDTAGVYLASFDVSNSIDILWGFGKKASLPLIITPNDTLHVTILSEHDGILFGKRARTCANLMEMYEAANRPRVQAYESEYTSDPRDFVYFMNDRLNSHLSFANRFCKSTKCTKTFVTWYIKSAYVSYYRNLADYCHAVQRKAMADPAQYSAFLRARDVILKNIDLNDPTLEMSSGYYDLLKSIFSLYVTPQQLTNLYYSRASALLLQKQAGVSQAERNALKRIQSGTYSESDLSVLTALTGRYKNDITSAMRNTVDPSVQQKLAEVKDPDLQKVLISYYKGLWSAI
jgi:hypothetical protein